MTEDEAGPPDGADASEDAGEPFDDESIDDTDEVDDPFARLDEDPSGEDAPGDDTVAGDPGAEDTPFGGGKTKAGERDPVGTGVDDPFDELGPATGETDADLDGAFEQMDTGSVTEEDVWESLDEDAPGGVDEFGGAASETDAAGSDLGSGFAGAGAGGERVISKRTYCQQCPHFSAPPAVSCDHEGTTILEAVGFDEFRVRNCPMVTDDDPTFDAARDE